MKLNAKILKKMLRAVINTRNDEISCDECFKEVDRFIEMELAGTSPEVALPLVHDHLRRCKECREEYEALLEAIQHTGADIV